LLDSTRQSRLVLQDRIDQIDSAIKQTLEIQAEIQQRLSNNSSNDPTASIEDVETAETERDRLIRTGKITPFAQGQQQTSLPDYRPVKTFFAVDNENVGPSKLTSKRRKLVSSHDHQQQQQDNSQHVDDNAEIDRESENESEYHDSPASSGETEESGSEGENVDAESESGAEYMDDGDEKVYVDRLQSWARQRIVQRSGEEVQGKRKKISLDIIATEMYEPSPNDPDAIFENGLKAPGEVYARLFEYQRVGVKWLWELHQQNAGGNFTSRHQHLNPQVLSGMKWD
jgi:DNA excision repair protein ERCC-6